MSMVRVFTSPKNTPRHPPPKPQAQAQAPRPPKPPHIQKVLGSIPAGSSSVLLLLLAVGCWLLAASCWLLASWCCCGCCCCCCFWWCLSPCSGARAIEWCCCCCCCCCCFWLLATCISGPGKAGGISRRLININDWTRQNRSREFVHETFQHFRGLD